METVFPTKNQDKHHLFQKVNASACKLYSAILFLTEDLDEDDNAEGVVEMKRILGELEALGDAIIGKEKADEIRKNEYAQQRLSRGDI